MSFGIYEITLQYFSPQGTKHVNEMKIEVFCDLEIHWTCEKVTQELANCSSFCSNLFCKFCTLLSTKCSMKKTIGFQMPSK